MDFEAVRAKVQGPGIGLIVYAVLSFIGQILGILGSALGGADMSAYGDMGGGVDPEVVAMVSKVVGIGGGCLAMVFAAVTLFAGLKMRELQSYGLCMAGSVLAMVPCSGSSLCCCCWIGLGVGIWSIMTLMKDDVKAAFQAQAAGGM